MVPPAIEVSDLAISYGDEVIFSRESFKLKGYGLTVVIGPNGAGKTTLFKGLLGLIPVRGRVLINGIDVTGKAEEAGKLVGYVPQFKAEDYSFPINVKEIVESAIALRRKPPRIGFPREVRARIREVMKMMGIWDIRSKPLLELSGGQRQRVFIARSLVWDPPVLIMDEPLTAVDPIGRADLVKMIKELAENKLVLVSSHDPSFFLDKTENLMVVNKRIVALGSPKEVLKEDLLSKVYGRSVFLVEKCVHVVDGYAI